MISFNYNRITLHKKYFAYATNRYRQFRRKYSEYQVLLKENIKVYGEYGGLLSDDKSLRRRHEELTELQNLSILCAFLYIEGALNECLHMIFPLGTARRYFDLTVDAKLSLICQMLHNGGFAVPDQFFQGVRKLNAIVKYRNRLTHPKPAHLGEVLTPPEADGSQSVIKSEYLARNFHNADVSDLKNLLYPMFLIKKLSRHVEALARSQIEP